MNRLLFFPVLLLAAFFQGDNDYRAEREHMVKSQIVARDVTDESTLGAMRTVPRHRFVPVGQVNNAYRDMPLAIGYGQTISQPYIVAYMTEVIRPKKDFRVLEIGTGSGYQAAVLAEIVDSVFTIEIVGDLGTAAKNRLRELEYNNVLVKIADGYYGWKEKGPFDAIVVTAAAEHIPPPLIDQLKNGGRMIIPVGSPFMTQQLVLVEKKHGKTTTRNLMYVRFVPFTRSE